MLISNLGESVGGDGWGFEGGAYLVIREFKKITMAGFTTAAVTNYKEFWREHISEDVGNMG